MKRDKTLRKAHEGLYGNLGNPSYGRSEEVFPNEATKSFLLNKRDDLCQSPQGRKEETETTALSKAVRLWRRTRP
jgi:hypothetical protein